MQHQPETIPHLSQIQLDLAPKVAEVYAQDVELQLKNPQRRKPRWMEETKDTPFPSDSLLTTAAPSLVTEPAASAAAAAATAASDTEPAEAAEVVQARSPPLPSLPSTHACSHAPRCPSHALLTQLQVELKKGETIMTDASLHLPAAFLHEAFSNRSGVPSDHFELYYRGKRLEGEAALASWGVGKDSIIEVKMRGRGGAVTPDGRPGSEKPAGGGGVGGAEAGTTFAAAIGAAGRYGANFVLQQFGASTETKEEEVKDELDDSESGGASRRPLEAAKEPEAEAPKSAETEAAAAGELAAKQADEIDILKARSMYNMVEDLELGDSAVKLLFLKNQQAQTIAKDSALIDLMIDKLVTKSPSLVINMLNSQGFQPWIDAQEEVKRAEGHAGVGEKAPFLSIWDESMALRRLDDFMVTVLIPLAAKTSALVICCATPCNCILSTSFTRMWRQQVD